VRQNGSPRAIVLARGEMTSKSSNGVKNLTIEPRRTCVPTDGETGQMRDRQSERGET
jgi:hypothetical protein